jgi:hypothetical protein
MVTPPASTLFATKTDSGPVFSIAATVWAFVEQASQSGFEHAPSPTLLKL